MNTDNNLILVKGEDKTEQISRCEYKNGKWQIQFGGGKTFSYSYSNVERFNNPAIHDPAETVVYHGDEPLSGVQKIMVFKYHIRICFATGYKKVYSKNELKLEQSCLKNADAHSCFVYLKQLSDKVGISNEEGKSLLSEQFKKLTWVSPSSVLAKYLNPTKLDKSEAELIPIFPFGFNLSQKEATDNALSQQISVIEGPPGTGKTQTILNIIANAVINEKTVAVVSNNNSATSNVLEKLTKYEVDLIAAYLGNKENKDRFLAEQTQTYPDMTAWEMSSDDYDQLRTTLQERGQELNAMLEANNKMAVFKQELSSLSVEKKYFDTYYKETNEDSKPYRSLYRHSSEKVMALWIDYQRIIAEDRGVTVKDKLKYLLRYGIVSFSFYNNTHDKIIAFFQKQYYEYRMTELEQQINKLSEQLQNYQFDKAMKKYSEDSMKLFKAKLATRYITFTRPKFTDKSLWQDFRTFNKEYPVILSTTHSLRSCASANYLFDYVIMDEASQVDIVTGALALSCAKNAVIVGDLKQLPNVVPEQEKEETTLIFNKFDLNNAYHYANNSILSSVVKLFGDVPKTLLKEHYRCHPKIIGFCNQKFYNNQLIALTDEADRDRPLVAYKTVKGNHARGKYNQRQIDVILEEILPNHVDKNKEQSVGIISPYRLQTEKLKAAGLENVEIDTVHKYQGREKDIIILTTVVNEVNEFVDNANLINVAVSRAVDKLILVVSDNEKNDNSNIGDLIRYIDYNNYEIIDSEIYSVFDLLYQNYSEKLLASMKHRKKVSQYESENLINAVIEKVLDLPEYQNLSHVMHQPLKMLIRNAEKLNDDECRFAMNVLTHTDFVIFNKLNKMPILVVEVDGYAYHANNPKQLERDKMKDIILEKYNIPILRLKTNESGEERRLRTKLSQILN
ncbi:AAA domain-containing protein [Dethiobacter alkaliphilus]|uniref:DNA helicase n=1 Tax=Dethiobacter alkaliphilus AHT 1 TaxID=555088 RepID=C0GD25_DETAL|nr:AAA domain-containing protein [Dethiobacter alkaliphilus]EEG79110.1 conserved hypothetical protein, putative DNA helicase [Dethiobacter alkaliphilus AHT 1]